MSDNLPEIIGRRIRQFPIKHGRYKSMIVVTNFWDEGTINQFIYNGRRCKGKVIKGIDAWLLISTLDIWQDKWQEIGNRETMIPELIWGEEIKSHTPELLEIHYVCPRRAN